MARTINQRLKFNRSFNRKVERALDQFSEFIMTKALPVLKKHPPIDTGNARRHWKKKLRGTKQVIYNRIVYIARLDRGWSKQKPDGILTPAIKELKLRTIKSRK